LHYVLVEVSAALRDEQRERLELEPPDEALGPFTKPVHDDDAPLPVSGSGPVFVALSELPALELTGVVIANELLDNLPFGIAQASEAGWMEVRIAASPTGEFTELLVPAETTDARALEAITDAIAVPAGARLPIPRGIDAWFASCAQVVRRGTLIVVDYVDDASGIIERARDSGAAPWLRTYRAHDHGGAPLDSPGSQDITADVVREQLLHAARRSGLTYVSDESQADWLRGLGIEEMVEAGRRQWEARAHIGDLAALAGRSRIGEADALTDPAGLGAHRVVTFTQQVS
jgi:SAM-dependent MidA family methyltransferase